MRKEGTRIEIDKKIARALLLAILLLLILAKPIY
jgi:hypothetical protein